jgi:hypothetical protein
MLVLLIQLAILVAILAGAWKMFEKAGKPGWAAIIPIYNGIVLLEIVGDQYGGSFDLDPLCQHRYRPDRLH